VDRDGDYRCFALLKNIEKRRTDGLRTTQNDMAVRYSYHCETTSNKGSNNNSWVRFPVYKSILLIQHHVSLLLLNSVVGIIAHLQL
jgi:hypothetical protein